MKNMDTFKQTPIEIMVSAFKWYHNIGDGLHHFAHYGSFISESQREQAIHVLGSYSKVPAEHVEELAVLKYFVYNASIKSSCKPITTIE